MKPRVPNQKTAALTLVEVLVIIGMLAIFFSVIDFGPLASAKKKAQQINCVNNLKGIGLANRIWEGNHGDKYPMQLSVSNGGTMELNAGGKNAWINFLVMSNELATPMVLWCPADKDHDLARLFETGFSATNVSYFVGLDASTNRPQMFLSGDDNFAVGGVPVKSGLLEFSANAPIVWTTKRHKNAGNIGLADGSVASVTDSGLINLLRQTGVATNRLAIP